MEFPTRFIRLSREVKGVKSYLTLPLPKPMDWEKAMKWAIKHCRGWDLLAGAENEEEVANVEKNWCQR